VYDTRFVCAWLARVARAQVVLVQIAVPSRTDVPEYQQLKVTVHGLVGRINGR
jgi:trehalose-6-phosphate synthase